MAVDVAALFEPVAVGRLTLRNRFVALPIGLTGFVDAAGVPTQRLVELYRRRAAGGSALVTVEVTYVDDRPCSRRGFVTLNTPKAIPAFALVADAIHDEGALAQIQVTPAWQADFPYRMSELERGEVERIIEVMVDAAVRVRDAGFDAVNVQSSNGWPLSRFLSRLSNDRPDVFGEPTEVLCRIIRGIRQRTGPGFAITVRIPADEMAGPEGITPAVCRDEIIPAVVEAGADLLDLSLGRGPIRQGIKGYRFDEADPLDRFAGIRGGLGVPVQARGRVTSAARALRFLEVADLVGVGTQLLADPDFPLKLLQGREEEVCRCIACDFCSGRAVGQGRTLQCAVNWELGREGTSLFPTARARADRRPVLVAGAGVAGLTVAWRLAEAGLPVEVWERAAEPGGLLSDLRRLPHVDFSDLHAVIDLLLGRLRRAGVEVRCGTSLLWPGEESGAGGDSEGASRRLAPAWLGEGGLGREAATGAATTGSDRDLSRFAAVVLATGAPGFAAPETAEGAAVTDDRSYMAGRPLPGRHIAVVARGEGAEVALSLARAGREVTLLEVGPHPARAPYVYSQEKVHELARRLRDAGVRVTTHATVARVLPGALEFSLAGGPPRRLECDGVVLAGRAPDGAARAPAARRTAAAGSPAPRPRSPLAGDPPAWPPLVRFVGDRLAPRGVGEATDRANAVARELMRILG